MNVHLTRMIMLQSDYDHRITNLPSPTDFFTFLQPCETGQALLLQQRKLYDVPGSPLSKEKAIDVDKDI